MNAPTIFNNMLLQNRNRLPSASLNTAVDEDITAAFSRFQDIHKNPYNLETLIFIYKSNQHGNFFVVQENINEIKKAFNALDRDGNGFLNQKDFEDKNPLIHSKFQQLWFEIQKRMDVNLDHNIAQDEFYAFFIAWTLETEQCRYNIYNSLVYIHDIIIILYRMTTSGLFAQDLKEWRNAFNNQMSTLIQQFLIFQNNVLSGSPVKG